MVCSADPCSPATSTLSLHDALPIFDDVDCGIGPVGQVVELRVRVHPADVEGLHLHAGNRNGGEKLHRPRGPLVIVREREDDQDRKSTRLNSSHGSISYAVFCLKKKK